MCGGLGIGLVETIRIVNGYRDKRLHSTNGIESAPSQASSPTPINSAVADVQLKSDKSPVTQSPVSVDWAEPRGEELRLRVTNISTAAIHDEHPLYLKDLLWFDPKGKQFIQLPPYYLSKEAFVPISRLLKFYPRQLSGLFPTYSIVISFLHRESTSLPFIECEHDPQWTAHRSPTLPIVKTGTWRATVEYRGQKGRHEFDLCFVAQPGQLPVQTKC